MFDNVMIIARKEFYFEKALKMIYSSDYVFIEEEDGQYSTYKNRSGKKFKERMSREEMLSVINDIKETSK